MLGGVARFGGLAAAHGLGCSPRQASLLAESSRASPALVPMVSWLLRLVFLAALVLLLLPVGASLLLACRRLLVIRVVLVLFVGLVLRAAVVVVAVLVVL